MSENIYLEIKSHTTVIHYSSTEIILALGDCEMDNFAFKHSPATPYEVEIAIEHIENVIMPARKQLPAILVCHCDDERLKQTANAIPNEIKSENNILSRQQIEIAFNQLVNVINGSPVSSTKIPSDNQFCAFLLIIREILHHWGIEKIILE